MNAPVGVYGPHPLAAAVIAAAIFAAIALACLALLAASSVGDRWRRRKTPVPGHPRPPIWRDAVTPQRQHAPAPGHPPHRSGGIEYAVEVYKCGCILLFDGAGRITGTTPCNAPDELDEELKKLLP